MASHAKFKTQPKEEYESIGTEIIGNLAGQIVDMYFYEWRRQVSGLINIDFKMPSLQVMRGYHTAHSIFRVKMQKELIEEGQVLPLMHACKDLLPALNQCRQTATSLKRMAARWESQTQRTISAIYAMEQEVPKNNQIYGRSQEIQEQHLKLLSQHLSVIKEYRTDGPSKAEDFGPVLKQAMDSAIWQDEECRTQIERLDRWHFHQNYRGFVMTYKQQVVYPIKLRNKDMSRDCQEREKSSAESKSGSASRQLKGLFPRIGKSKYIEPSPSDDQ